MSDRASVHSLRSGASSAPREPYMSWTRWFRDVTADDVASVGGKNASLGEMLREVTPLGVEVPDGFAVTADAYRAFLREAGLEATIRETLAGLAPANVDVD